MTPTSPAVNRNPEENTTMTTPPVSPVVVINELGAERIRIPLLGTAPLIVNRFTEKAKRQLLDNMQGRKTPQGNKNPEADYQAAFYRTDDGGYGFPVIAFKAATVGAARFYGNSVTMVGLRQSMFFDAPFSKAEGQKLAALTGEPHQREDVVRVGKNGTDLRYRPEFTEWSTEIDVVYVTSQLDRGSVLSLVNAGGLGVGVGEWRPERSGDFGTYTVDPSREVQVVSA